MKFHMGLMLVASLLVALAFADGIYGDVVTVQWCSSSENRKDVCNGELDDCWMVGMDLCDSEGNSCYGIMVHSTWTPANNGVKLCLSDVLVDKASQDWQTRMKTTSIVFEGLEGYIRFDGYCLDASGNTFERTCGPSESAAACKSSCDDSADCGAAESASNGDWCCLISETDSRLIASGDGFANSRCYVKRCDLGVKNDRVWYGSFDLPGDLRTVNTAEECRQRCANTPSCFYFNFYPSSGCRLVGKDATLTSLPRYFFRLASGAVRCEHRIFSQKAAPGQCLSSLNDDIGLVLGNTPHTIQVRLTFPESAPSGKARQWILNLGRGNTGDHHWIWNSNTRVQFGKWNGAQIKAAAINQCTELTTTSSRGILKLYCNRRLLAEENTDFSIESSQLSIGRSPPIAAGSDFAGCISEVTIWAYEKSAGEILNLKWEDIGNGVCVDGDHNYYMGIGLFGDGYGFSGTKESCKQLCASYKWCVGINFVNSLNMCYLYSGVGDGLPIAGVGGFLDVWGTGAGPIARTAFHHYDNNDWECHRIANFDVRWLD